MLNFSEVFLTLQKQADKIGKETSTDNKFLANFLQTKLKEIEFQKHLAELEAKTIQNSWAGFFGQTQHIDELVKNYSVLAVDGSQIWPDRHLRLENVALVQVAGVLIEYGQTSSRTQYFNHVEVLFAQDFAEAAFDKKLVEQYRDLLELECAIKWAQELKANPTVLMDGSLKFLLDRFNSPEKTATVNFSQRFFAAIENWTTQQLKMLFYTSRPNSHEFTQLLRIAECRAPYFDKNLCRGNCQQQSCIELSRINDSILFSEILTQQNSSQIFSSRVEDLKLFNRFIKNKNCGEVGRIEWLESATPEIILDQIEKGQGYPVSLALAHHMAVINFQEQSHFVQMLMQMQQTAQAHQSSLKLQKKQFMAF